MSQVKFPKAKKADETELQAFKVLFDYLASLEKRIEQLEEWRKRNETY